MIARQVFWLYNLATLTTRRERGQADPAGQVAAEVRAILATGPAVLGINEAVGHDLPQVPGYRLVRDRSSESRANIAAYQRSDVAGLRARWHDLRQTWSRTQHAGQHPPRSFVSFRTGGCRTVVAHQAPKGTDNTVAAQEEGVVVLSGLLVTRPPGRPALVIMDANRRRGEAGPGPSSLADRVGGQVVGDRIDCAVVTGDADVEDVDYVSRVGAVRLRSDHPHALRFTLAADERWWRSPGE